MDISIIISGNLTGFSRFYASPNANDTYNEAKFDFDYRNFLTFINAGEKAYAISFSPKVIAVSLITRILDSFRRPGILVVTALVPRYQLVSGALNAQDKSAIYRLLNEINDKFYEKNFLNGMVNQNPAVLMQDYYSDILRNYTLVSDRMQKAVNTTIEVNSPNKRIGYVSTSEKDMPKYLSSLMRKSYNGYHHVFFADKAPTNIDEPAEEIVTYRARIENGNRNVPGEVRLTDKIPTVAPEQGERPLSNTNFTYGQVLNGEAGADIIGTIENDTIVLTFRFPKEEKTVYFKFFDGANKLPIHVLRPILVETNGTSMPISTDSITFYGKEIYGRKTIKSGNPEYTVESSSSIVDLQRYNNGTTINVYVSKGWTWTFDPMINNRRVNIKPISITLVNKYTGEKKYIARVTGYVTERLSGSAQEWEMQIESDYYKSATFPATGPYRLDPKPQPSPTNHGGTNGGNGTNGHRYGDGTRTHGNSTSNQGLKFTNGQNNDAKDAVRLKEKQRKRYLQIGVFSLVAILCCIGGDFAYDLLIKDKKENFETKPVLFTFAGSDNLEIKDSKLLSLLDLTLTSNNVKITDTNESNRKEFSYNKDEEYSVNALVSLIDVPENQEIILFDKVIPSSEITDPYKIVLSVSEEDLLCYSSLINNELPESKSFNKRVQALKDRNELKFANMLLSMYDSLKQQEDARKREESERLAQEKAEQKRLDEERKKEEAKNKVDWTRLDRVDASLSTIAEVQNEALQKNIPIPQKYQERIVNLERVINILRTGIKPATTGLSTQQASKISNIWKDKDEKDKEFFSKYKGQFRQVNSISDFENKLKKIGKL